MYSNISPGFLFTLFIFALSSCKEGKSTTTELKKDDDKIEQINQELQPDEKLQVFSIYNFENGNSFVSVSDILKTSNHKDSILIPSRYLHNKNIAADSLERIVLKDQFRNRLFNQTGFKEIDSMFVFNFETGKKTSFALKNLKTVAYLSPYESGSTNVDASSFMIGFETNELKGNTDDFGNSYVSFGQKNPFNKKLEKVMWKETNASSVPKYQTKYPKQLTDLRQSKIQVFEFKNADFHYYIEDFEKDNLELARHLLVFSAKDGKLVKERLFEMDEGNSFTPAKSGDSEYFTTFTGDLFKDQPPVIFGLIYQSFGCEDITFIDPKKEELWINCDNRH